MKLLILTNVPAPYRVDFFNELGKRCGLTVLYQREKSLERDDSWKSESNSSYKTVFLKGITTGTDNAFCPGVSKYMNTSYDAIIICGNSSPTEIMAIECCKMRKIPYMLEGDGAFADGANDIKDKIKSHLIHKVSLCFSTCTGLDNYYKNYGAKPESIRRYRFSSLKAEDILSTPVTADEKQKIKAELGIEEEKIVLYAGQYIYRKGIDVLLGAATNLNKETGIYLVGGAADSDYLSFVAEHQLNHVHFSSFKTKEELKLYYRAADVFVLPTREDIWGLVVNEAMANALPVVTTDRCNAGLELIRNGANGYIVPVEDSEKLASAIDLTLGKSTVMGDCALETIRNYTIENMVEDHMKILEAYKNHKL